VHVFLTGELNVGKSTIIKKILETSGMNADGFITYWKAEPGGARRLYLSSYPPDAYGAQKAVLAEDLDGLHTPLDIMTNVFNSTGAQILGQSGKGDLVIMDEIGVFELEAELFLHAIMAHVYGDVPILGVLKAKALNTGFVKGITGQANVRVVEVTAGNRNGLAQSILAMF